MEKLNAAWQAASQHMYAGADGAAQGGADGQGQGPQGQGQAAGDGVADAEYEEVK
jgi:molecular chaperone DnaK